MLITTEVDLCNLALSHLGITEKIGSLDDTTTQAEQCKLLYETVRDGLLTGHDWSFATKVDAPDALTTVTHPRWTTFYAYPDDCLRLRRITSDGQAGPGQEFGIFLTKVEAANARVIGTTGEAYLEYIARVADLALYPPEVTEALAWGLAVRLAPALSRNAGLAQNALVMYQRALGAAMLADAREGRITPASRNRYGEARG